MEKIAVERSSLANAAYERLVQGLLNQELRPGTRLLMDDIAAQLGISRTPVRDALLRLERELVIEPYGGRGYVIRELSDEDLDQRYAAREAVEGYAAAEVAAKGGAAVDTVRETFDRLCQLTPTTAVEVFEMNRDVHRSTVEVLDNVYVLAMFDTIWSAAMSSHVWADIFESTTDGVDFAEDHRPLIEAIEGANPDHARAVAVAHIRTGRLLHAPHPHG